MLDRGGTDPQTLVAAFDTARAAGLKYVYVGNLRNVARQYAMWPDRVFFVINVGIC